MRFRLYMFVATLFALMLLTFAPPAHAQVAPSTAPSVSTAETVNNVVSYGEVSANLLFQTLNTLSAPNRSCAAKQEAFSVGFAFGMSELLKAVVRKQRPDGSDFKSFPSEHTALAAASSGWSVYYGTSIAIGTGASRVAANKHDKRDVLAGFAIGYGGQQLAKLVFRCDPQA